MGFAVTSYSDGAVGILSASIISLDQSLNTPDSETALQTDTDRYNLFLEPVKVIDQKALTDYIDPINSKKADVATNGSLSVWQSHEKLYTSVADANDATETLYGQTTQKDGLFSKRQIIQVVEFTGTPASGVFGSPGYTPSNPGSNGSFGVGATVAQVGSGATGNLLVDATLTAGSSGRIIIQNCEGDFDTGLDPISIDGTVGIISTINAVKYFGQVEIYDDIMVSYVYPNLETASGGPDPGQEDIYDNAENQIITSTNKGNGIGNTFFQNALSTSTSEPSPVLDLFVDTSTSITKLGNVYTFDTSSASSNASTISTKKSEIQTLRQGTGSPQTSVIEFSDASSVVKNQKIGYAVNVWSGERMKVVMTSEKSSFETAISVLTNSNFQ